MRKPSPLKIGDRVALLAPSSPVSDEKRQQALESLQFLGLVPIEYPSCKMRNGYLSGTDLARAKDLNDAFLDSEINGIFCIRGGYGATRILPLLDYDEIAKHPKIFVGYSDITALHVVLNQQCHFQTVHGPMPSTGYHGMDYYSLERLAELLFHRAFYGILCNPDGEALKKISPGNASGPIVGGNLSVLVSTLGSPYEVDTREKILFLEDVEAEPYEIDRNLTALALAGKLRDCNGILIGTFTDCDASLEDPYSSLTIDQVIEQVILPFEKPTIGNLRCGHSYPTMALPMGSLVSMQAERCIIEFHGSDADEHHQF